MPCTNTHSSSTSLKCLRAYFAAQEDTLVDGDFPLYYLDADGKRQYVKPDCGVAFGVNPDYIYARNGYFLEEVGKTLNFVLEIASTTTADNDTGRKRRLYEWLKVREYFGFDGTGGEYYQTPLFGWRLRDGQIRPGGDDVGRQRRDMGVQRATRLVLLRRTKVSTRVGP